MRSRSAFAICGAVLLSIGGLAPEVVAAPRSPLGRIAIRTSDLPSGVHLARQGGYNSHVQGYRTGYRWTFRSGSGAGAGGIIQVTNTVVKYRHRQYAAQGALTEDARQCGSKLSSFGYHPLTPVVGDFASGCFYPGAHGRNTVAITLRRFSYVAMVRVTGTAALNVISLPPLAEHLASLVDRRIEIAVHGTGLLGAPKPPKGTKHSKKHHSGALKLLSCNHPRGCLFRASGRGSGHYGVNWSAMPKSWKFQPPSRFKVSYAYGCGHASGLSDAFTLVEVDDLNATTILIRDGAPRASGAFTAGLPPGARKAVLQIQVQNSSCTWYVKAYKFREAFPQPKVALRAL